MKPEDMEKDRRYRVTVDGEVFEGVVRMVSFDFKSWFPALAIDSRPDFRLPYGALKRATSIVAIGGDS